MYKLIRHKQSNIFPLGILSIIALIFIISFGLVNILKFRIFSPTCFGWAFFNMYPKLAMGCNPSAIFMLPEGGLIIILAPINYFLSLLYRLYPKPEALLVLQTIIMASGIFPIYLLARKRLNNSYLAFAFSLAYLFNPIITTGAMLGYIPLALGLPFLLWSFYYLEKGNIRRFIFFIILANLAKIDIVIMTTIMGIILFVSNTKRKYGKSILAVNIIWLITIIGLCFFYLRLIEKPFPVGLLHFDKYGDNVKDALSYVLSNPLAILKNLFNTNNMLIYIFYSLPNIFALLSPTYLLCVIPEVVFVLIRNEHSSAHFLILAFVFISAIYGTERIFNIMGRNFKSLYSVLLSVIILIFSLGRHYYLKPKSNFGDSLGRMPFTRDFSFDSYKSTKHTKIGYKFLKMIPPNVTCLATQSLAPHLSRCKSMGIFEIHTVKEDCVWDYVFVDLSKGDFYNVDKQEFYLKLRQFLEKDGYGVEAFEDSWLLLKKGKVRSRINKKEVLEYIK